MGVAKWRGGWVWGEVQTTRRGGSGRFSGGSGREGTTKALKTGHTETQKPEKLNLAFYFAFLGSDAKKTTFWQFWIMGILIKMQFISKNRLKEFDEKCGHKNKSN